MKNHDHGMPFDHSDQIDAAMEFYAEERSNSDAENDVKILAALDCIFLDTLLLSFMRKNDNHASVISFG